MLWRLRFIAPPGPFSGAVRTAASSGWDYLPIYLGPAFVFLFLPGLLKRIGSVVEREGVTSLFDFLAARYGKSRSIGAIGAVVGSLPHIALQLKSVGVSVQALLNPAGETPTQSGAESVLITPIGLALIALLDGDQKTAIEEDRWHSEPLLCVSCTARNIGSPSPFAQSARWRGTPALMVRGPVLEPDPVA